MKHLTLCILVSISLLACNNKKKNAIPETATPAEVAEARSESEAKTEEFQQLTPYTPEQMRSLLPAEMDGDSTHNLEAGNYSGTAYVTASYQSNDSTYVVISLFDLGGPAGAGIYNNQFVNRFSEQWERGTEYRKVIDFNGGKAIEQADSKQKICVLNYVDDRFLVQISGNNVDISDLKDKADDLKLK